MKYFTLDLACGYWQIELDENSKEKTAFVVDNVFYKFNSMPFGLCNAPATFQRLMNKALRGLLGKKVLVYLDDFIIFLDLHKNISEIFKKFWKFYGRLDLKSNLRSVTSLRKKSII